MLVLSRMLNEKIKIGDDILITVVAILPDRVKIGITAPDHVRVLRCELLNQLKNRTATSETNNHGLERPAS